jgi:hypothetical protein
VSADATPATSPASFYAPAARDAEAELARRTRAGRRASVVRLLLAALAVVVWSARDRVAPPVARLTLGGAVAAFVAVAWWHRRERARGVAAARRLAAARAGLARTERRWADVPALRSAAPLDGWRAAVARDLGVTTDAPDERSLTRLLDVVHPALGGRRLLDWLLDAPAPAAEIAARQASTEALRARPALLLDVAAEARHGGAPVSAGALAAFRAWCEAPGARAVGHTRGAWVAGALTAALVVVAATLGLERGGTLVVGLLLAQLVASGLARRRLDRELGTLALAPLAGAVRVMARLADEAPLPGRAGEAQERLAGERAAAAFGALVRLLEWNEVRRSPMGHWALNAVVALDAQLLAALARWRRAHGGRAPAWLDDAADAEALLALGTLAFEHPAWTLPAVHDDAGAPLEARSLAHALLAPSAAVASDATLRAPGDVVVVSGPNMAGKTTYLRAVGLAALLAQAGGAVPAASLRLRRCRVRTSVRVEDDLARGVSLFLAEVTRLRDVVRDAEAPGGPPVLYLFDEVLHGTNAADRRVATRTVLAALRRAGASGVVTTHDPTIAAPDGVGPAPQEAHFDGRVTRGADGAVTLGFDYVARPGPATHANALALLEMLGLPPAVVVPGPEDQEKQGG